MIGIDTNILVRYILNDDPEWSAPARRFIDEDCSVEQPGYINLIVLMELIWVLSRRPDSTKDKLCTVIVDLLLADNLVLERSDLVASALDAFKAGNAGFADFIIAAINQSAGASATVTIDKFAAKQPGFIRLTK